MCNNGLGGRVVDPARHLTKMDMTCGLTGKRADGNEMDSQVQDEENSKQDNVCSPHNAKLDVPNPSCHDR